MLNLSALNKAQRSAVMHGEGPLLVVAGPGSGKTFTITQRILYLIEQMQVPPEEILVITFTKEAAQSMQRRFQEQSEQAYPVIFGTFHSVFYHILNQSQGSNYNQKRQILQQSQKKQILYNIIKKQLQQQQNTGIGGVSIQRADDMTEDLLLLIAAISFYKNTGDMEAAKKKLPEEWQHSFPTLYDTYEAERRRKRALDFDDMVCECAELLAQNRQLRKDWQDRFTHILMDEFQDISPMQYRVVQLLSKEPHNLFAVGDDDQSIYGFRGTSSACLKQFQEDFKAEQVLLDVNYRSHEEIVKASLRVIAENKERFSKSLIAHKKMEQMQVSGEVEAEPVCVKVFQEREEQNQYLTDILAQKNNHEQYAVLFRTNSYMQSFAARLQRQGIAFCMKEKMDSIYENSIVKDIMAYLQIASGENTLALWLRILNKPSRYISREALADCDMEQAYECGKSDGSRVEQSNCAGNDAKQGKRSRIENIKSYYDSITADSYSFCYLDKIRSAIRVLEKQLEYLRRATPFLGVQYIRRVIGYDKYIKEQCAAKREGAQRYEEAMELLTWLTEEAKAYTTIEAWLAEQERYNQNLQERVGNTAQIHLLTIHASKGLEFDRVWIPDCNEKIFPHGAIPDKKTCEEERRIFYVGMTRAKKSLELLCTTGTKERPRLISRFLNPLWKHYSSSPTTSSNSH